MSERCNQVLEEASERVNKWPEWKKSDALKQSERLLKSKLGTADLSQESERLMVAAAAGK